MPWIEVQSLSFLASCFPSRSLSISGQLELRIGWNVGTLFFSFLPMSSSAGEYPQASGVDLYANSPLDGSVVYFQYSLHDISVCTKVDGVIIKSMAG